MDCSCNIPSYGYSDADFVDVYESEIRRSRKGHTCCECRQFIGLAEEYEHTFVVYDGEPHSYKTCLHCKEARDAFFDRDWIFERVWEDITDYIDAVRGDITEDCLSELSALVREKILAIIEKVWEELDE